MPLEEFIPYSFQEKGVCHAVPCRATGEAPGWAGGRGGGEDKAWLRASFAFSVGKTRQVGRQLSTAELKCCQRALGYPGWLLVVCYLFQHNLGQGKYWLLCELDEGGAWEYALRVG